MVQAKKQKKVFLSLCGQRDYDLLTGKEAERTDREFDILKDYPEYFKDENVYEQTDEWIEDFISQAPPAKRDEIRQLIKENTEII